VTPVNGTCSAWFWYRNNTQEIDLEFLSKAPAVINAVLQSNQSAEAGFDASKTDSAVAYSTDMLLSEGFHEYRWDWYPDFVQFFLDGLPIANFSENVPVDSGHLMLSHWSNGNPGWSRESCTSHSHANTQANISFRSGPTRAGCFHYYQLREGLLQYCQGR
jgi:beta-glucanase (GH16 family)